MGEKDNNNYHGFRSQETFIFFLIHPRMIILFGKVKTKGVAEF